MSYHQDWLMRQIEAISAMLAFMLTGKKPQEVTVEEHIQIPGGGNSLAGKLLALVRDSQLCEAENLLFEAMEQDDPEVPEAALAFYTAINKLSDMELEKANFSREEIKDGLEAVARHYGLIVF